ncbi:MAG TPA: hypothetical protein VHA52_05155 [Candidatus Babeliaceae bacterium]|nr:hypothetical protein [Candidatus Babeliaceae bacterium]
MKVYSRKLSTIMAFSLLVFVTVESIESQQEKESSKKSEQGWLNWASSGFSSGLSKLNSQWQALSAGSGEWWTWGKAKAAEYLKGMVNFTGSLFQQAQGLANSIANKLGAKKLTSDIAEKDPIASAAYAVGVSAQVANAYAEKAQELYQKGETQKAEQFEKVAQHLGTLTKRALSVTEQTVKQVTEGKQIGK